MALRAAVEGCRRRAPRMACRCLGFYQPSLPIHFDLVQLAAFRCADEPVTHGSTWLLSSAGLRNTPTPPIPSCFFLLELTLPASLPGLGLSHPCCRVLPWIGCRGEGLGKLYPSCFPILPPHLLSHSEDLCLPWFSPLLCPTLPVLGRR